MSRIERVLIVGAGLAGSALACVLRRSGVRCELVERRARRSSEGAGLLLPGNAVKALDRLEVGPQVRARGVLVERMRFTDGCGELLFDVELASQPGWTDFVSIHRSALHELLLERASPVSPRRGRTVVALEEQPGGVRVRLSDGGEATYDLVVGADGLRSDLRAAVLGGASPEPIAGLRGWRFVAPRPAGLACSQYMLGAGRTFLLHPLAGGEVYCGAGPVSDRGAGAVDDSLEQMRADFSDFGGPAREVLESLDATTPLCPTQYWHISLPSWHRGRCVLIGDAAHACAPTLAEGAAMAFEDALVLGELLARDAPVESLLCSFEERRRPRVEFVQRESLARMEAARMAGGREIEYRNAIFRKLGAVQLTDIWGRLMDEAP